MINVKVTYLFSKNDKIGSKLISWASGLLIKDLITIPSHMAILIQFKGSNDAIVLESVLSSGVRIVPYDSWKKINTICYRFTINQVMPLDQVFKIIDGYWGKKYDWAGIAFFALCFIKYILFKCDFPDNNAWQSDNKYFCNELGGVISGYNKYSMTTPAKMCSDFKKLYKELDNNI